MPAREEISIKKLAIIAGSGVLPAQLLAACQAQNIETIVIGYKGYTDEVTPDFWTRIGSSGSTAQYLQSQNVSDVVMIGAIKRPGLIDLWPDWRTFKFFFKAWVKSLGDSGLLDAARHEIENLGFKLRGAHEFLPELLMPEGVLGIHQPRRGNEVDVQIGIQAARILGQEDVGQAVIVKDGQVIGLEDKRGTSALIKRHGTDGAVLVKMCKPQQDKNLDLPTIGPETARICAEKKMAGIVGQAGNSLLVERVKVRDIADENTLFVMGVTIDE